MTPQRIALLEHQLRAVRAIPVAELRRPHAAKIAVLQPGDLLWIAEPFHLPRRFDAIAPTQALKLGAKPTFVSDATLAPEIGRRRFARELPRVWHRQHLVVQSVRTECLHDIDDAAIAAAGFLTREGFARAWDAGVADFSPLARWRENPAIVVLTVAHVAAPLPSHPEN